MRARLQAGLIAAFALGLTACSATKLAYNNLDWLADRQIGNYVELDEESESLFERNFQTLWHWHRGTQLALYARDLREMADAAGEKLSPEQLRDFFKRANDHAQRVAHEALPGAAGVLQALDDEQVARLIKRMAEERAERLEEDAELDQAQRQKRATRDFQKMLKRWIGALLPEQKQRAQAWVEARQFDEALWQRYSEQWAAQFDEALMARAQPDFPARLHELMLDPKTPDSATALQMQTANQESAEAMLSELSGTLSAKQREHLQSELRDLADDLSELAAGAASSNPVPAQP